MKQVGDRVNVILLHNGVNGTTKTEEASFSWVVGADGAKGAVRKQLGLRLVGETAGQSFVIGDVVLEGLSTDVSCSSISARVILFTFLRQIEVAHVGRDIRCFVSQMLAYIISSNVFTLNEVGTSPNRRRRCIQFYYRRNQARRHR